MTYIEPVGLGGTWDDGSDKSVSYEIRLEPLFDVFDRLGYEKLSEHTLREEIEHQVETSYSKGFHFSPDMLDKMSSNMRIPLPNVRRIYYSGKCTVFPYTVSEDFCIFMGESKQIVEKAIKEFEKEIELHETLPTRIRLRDKEEYVPSAEEVKPIAHRGSDFADRITKSRYNPVQIGDEIDNNFERKIYTDLRNEITSCITTNADLFVGSDTKENREYDFLIHISPTCRIYIEAKSVLSSIGVSASNDWKRNLIGKPFEYKVMLENQTGNPWIFPDDEEKFCHTECIVVVDSLDNEKFRDYPDMARDRNIQLLEYDEEGDYISKIRSTYIDLLYKYTRPFEDYDKRRSFL